MRPLLRLCVAGIAAILLANVTPVRADPAVTFDNLSGLTLGNPPFTLGWQFNVNQPVVVTALGVFDSFQDGFEQSHPVGIWDSGGALLTSGTLSVGIGDPLINQFRYVDVTPIILGPGTYQIGALWLEQVDGLIFPSNPVLTNFAVDPLISYLQPVFAFGGVLADPLLSDGSQTDNAFFGPNFILAAAVPEPATMALLGGLLLGFGMMRRRKRT